MLKRFTLASACLLVLAGCQKNAPPMAPSLEGPAIAERRDSVRVTAYSFDRESDSLSYLFAWGDGTESGWGGPIASGIECVTWHVYEDAGRYGVTAKCRDAGHETDWSDTLLVHVGEYGPYVPHRPSGPDTVPVGDSVAFVTAAGHPLQRRVAFQFDWGDTLGDWSGFVRAGEFFSAHHAFTRGGVMAVRARARDTLEHVSDWSRPESVVVIDTFRFRQPDARRSPFYSY